MKTTILSLLTFGFIYAASADEHAGLYLRAVVDEETSDAVLMTSEDGRTVYVSSDAIITPDDVESAKVKDGKNPAISFFFNDADQKKLGEATRTMIGKKLAITIDRKLISTPIVQSEFSTGADVTGNFTREWAEDVVERANTDPKG